MKLSNFKKYAGSVITRRADAYLAQGRVQRVEGGSGEGEYAYVVHGTDDYNVRIRIDGDEILSTSCDCPYNGMCKHITAALMDIRNEARPSAGVMPATDNPASEDSLQFTLCYLAFSGSGSYPAALLKHCPPSIGSLNLTTKSFEGNKKILGKRGLLGSGPHLGAVSPDKVILALLTLVRDHKDWLQYFERTLRQPDYLLYLTDVAKVIAGETGVMVHHFHSPSYRYYEDPSTYVKIAIINVMDSMTQEQMTSALDDVMLCELAAIYIDSVLESDNIRALEKAGLLLSLVRHSSATSASLHSRYRLAVFYARAEELPSRPSAANHHYTYYLDAAKARLKNDDAATAIRLYQEGLKIQNKKSTAKNIPDDSISFFFYVIALSIRRSPKDVTTLTTIHKKRNDRQFYNYSWVFPLVEFSVSVDQSKDTWFLDSAKSRFKYGEGHALNAIAALTACFFGMKEKWTWTFPSPRLGILRKECEHYFGEKMISWDDAFAPSSWPYKAALPKIPVRAVWVRQLEDLIRQVGNAEDSSDTGKKDEKRLYYLAYDCQSRHLEVREQGRLSGGGWSKGKNVSLLRYKTGDCPMDEIDKRIYERWLKGDPAHERYYAQSELPSLELVLPYLVGTDKLALHSRGPLFQCEVREEKPFLWTQKRDGEIYFHTNVPKDACEYSSMYVHNPSSREFVIYPIPQDLKPAYKRILTIGHMPAEAEPMLEKLFTALRGRLEVHSDISGGISLKKVEGSPVIIVRITPERERFLLSAFVRPLDGGSAEFFPGEGRLTVYDSVAGERAEISRNMRKEMSNLRKVNALLPAGCIFLPGAQH